MREMFCLIPTYHYELFLAWVSPAVSALVMGDALCSVDAGLRQRSFSPTPLEQRNHHPSAWPVVSFAKEKEPKPASSKGSLDSSGQVGE